MKSSMSFIVERRRFFRVACCTLLLCAWILGLTAATTRKAFAADALYSAIIVDLAPIKATGLGDFANPIGAAVKRALNKTYAGLVDKKNTSLPVLIVEVATIYYGQEEETFIAPKLFPNMTQTRDQMSGAAIVRKGKSDIAHVSVLGTHVARGGWPPIDDVKSGRLDALASEFADAVRSELGD